MESTKENNDAKSQNHEKHIPFKYRLLWSMDMGQYGANCAIPRVNFDLKQQKALSYNTRVKNIGRMG